MSGNYDPLLVVLSIVVAVFASYTALDLASSVAVARGRARHAWLAAGALAMGVGIWSMHFVGMLAFSMPGMRIAYDIPLVVLSAAIAILASALALFVASRERVTASAMVLGALAMGAAIAGMHYTGVWSMRMPAGIEWNLDLVFASIVIAVTASFAGLWLAFRYRLERSGHARRIRVGGGVLMGLAIAGMHYTAMAAARFVPHAVQLSLRDEDVLATAGLGIAVTGTTLLILAVAVAGSAISRELARRTVLAEDNASLYRAAEAARREAEELAEELQNQASHLQEQAAELEALNDELGAAEGRLRGIVDAALDAMIVTDVRSIIIEWNAHAEIVFGWSAEEAVGKTLLETIIPPQHGEAHQRGIARYLTTGDGPVLNRRIEITALRRDGREFPVELAIAPVRAGNQLFFTAFIRDITERRQAEEERRESEKREQLMRVLELERSRLKTLFEQAPAFIAVLRGSEHVFDIVNAQYEQLIGHRDVLGKPLHEALPELEGQGFLELLDRVYQTGEPYVGRGTRVLLQREEGADLEERYMNFIYQPLFGPDEVSGIFVHGVDVSDLVRTRQEAEEANRAKNEFLSRMSHELRTPLNAILGFGQLLGLDVEGEENQESVEQIMRAGKHLLALVDEVLDIARIEAGQMSLSVEPVPIGVVLRESVDLVRLTATRGGITLRVQDALATERFIAADQQRLKQVMLNLLSNAIKYNRREGTITLSSEEVGENRLRISVRDTGYGIPHEKLERLFTPFDRLGADQTAVEGTGLGLALSKGLVEAMGGTMGAESTEGEGSRFWVEFSLVPRPTIADPAAEERVALEVPGEEAGRTHTVLFVEDNLANVRLMERIFQRRPAVRLLTAMQGSLGLELAREQRPDLILLDLNLPDLTGDKVLLQIRRDPALREIPVVMISGDAIPFQIERMLDLGAQDYITKPFEIPELLRIVDDYLTPEEQ